MIEREPHDEAQPSSQSPEADQPSSKEQEASHDQERGKSRLEGLIHSLAESYQRPGFDVIAAAFFERLGILDHLLASGIVSPEDPNPYDFEQQFEAYDQWWNDHPEIDPWEEQQKHEKALTYLYIGARIGLLAGRYLRERTPERG